MALASARGADVTVLCLSYGERGEPHVLLDITEVFTVERSAMECLRAQPHMWDDYPDLSRRGGVQLQRNAGPNLGLAHSTMAEAYMRCIRK
jgi:4-oxalomesaconate hydratase